MDPISAFIMGLSSRRSKKKTSGGKQKKKKADNWFETLTVTQLKDLCKAGKLKQSGTKPVLCQRLLEHNYIRDFIWCTQSTLKYKLKEKMLVQSGNKYEQVLRLVQYEYGTKQVKRAATETITDSVTGEEKQVLKKRKINPKPETMYTRIEKKIKSVSQKKYQTYFGSKSHSCDVFQMLKDLTKEFCIESGILKTDPMLAFLTVKAGWSAIYDFWQFFERPGYAEFEVQRAIEALQSVLLEVMDKGLLSKEDIEDMVVLLENIDACLGDYCLNTGYQIRDFDEESGHNLYDGSKPKCNIVEKTIRVIMPDYDKESRNTKPVSKDLECDIRGFCALNGIQYPPNSSK